ncbi:MAG: hypothetical protein BWY82_01293 [Verrucomicrobia bacterium ADurb.Bin474]|nr:MAG: hypothetical protein BWY82_01293 [Verrucomicrobia bacterium ADurb.Bin474]
MAMKADEFSLMADKASSLVHFATDELARFRMYQYLWGWNVFLSEKSSCHTQPVTDHDLWWTVDIPLMFQSGRMALYPTATFESKPFVLMFEYLFPLASAPTSMRQWLLCKPPLDS